MARATFTVIYRTGGTHNAKWHRCSPVDSKTEAELLRLDLERMGYRALVHETSRLDAIGMPEGWDASDVPTIKMLCHVCWEHSDDPDETHCPHCGARDIGKIDIQTGERI